MITKTIINNEETVTLGNDIVKITNCRSFQNTGDAIVRWSSIPFDADNEGAVCEVFGERIFTQATPIYFLGADRESHYNRGITGRVHVRKDI